MQQIRSRPNPDLRSPDAVRNPVLQILKGRRVRPKGRFSRRRGLSFEFARDGITNGLLQQWNSEGNLQQRIGREVIGVGGLSQRLRHDVSSIDPRVNFVDCYSKVF